MPLDRQRKWRAVVLLQALLLIAPAWDITAAGPPDSVMPHISSPRALAHFMHRHFEFVQDGQLFGTVDYWQTPEEFWSRRAGDCEDYAVFAQHILRQMNLEAYVVSFYGERGYGHTVTAYKEGGRFNLIDQTRHRRYRTKTLEEALSRLYPRWIWGAIAERRGTRGWLLREIRNPDRPS